MTDELIKQAAYEYINSNAVRPENMQLAFGDFIAGAHSRDEEIYDLKRDIEDLQKMVKMRSDAFECARKEIGRLSSQWISVKERLPEVGSDNISIPVAAITNKGYWFKGQFDFNNKDWFFSEDPDHLDFEADEFVTHWMPIPKVNKEK